MKINIPQTEIINLYNKGLSPAKIGEICKCSNDTIRRFLKRLGLYQHKNYACRKYTLNEHFFDDVDNEIKAYWLGFIAADGYVTDTPRKTVSIQLALKDHNHLQNFLDAVQSNKPIYTYIKKGRAYPQAMLNSSLMVCSLKKYNITQKKSLTLQWPKKLKAALYPHFIRGYFDGDGTWHINKNNRQITFGFIGTENFLQNIQSILATRNIKAIKLQTNKKAKMLYHHGNRLAKNFYDFIYANATIWLPRKRQKVESLISTMPR